MIKFNEESQQGRMGESWRTYSPYTANWCTNLIYPSFLKILYTIGFIGHNTSGKASFPLSEGFDIRHLNA